MTRHRTTRILCVADPRGAVPALERALALGHERDAHAVALVGDLSSAPATPEDYRAVFRALADTDLPCYWVPGPGDAPIAAYLREAHNVEVVYPFLRGVHGTIAFAPGHVLVAGMGGEVSDDPDAPRDEIERLRYPRWEPEYRLKLVRELSEHQLVLLVATPPAHKGHGTPGSEVLTELIASHRPRLVVSGGERRTEMIGRSLVVAPGSVGDGHYAVADLHAHTAELEDLAGAVA
jgi:Icc-related predicted phosphoesterase